MIRRPPRSTLSSSSAASDVYKRQVLVGVGQVGVEVLGQPRFGVEREQSQHHLQATALQPRAGTFGVGVPVSYTHLRAHETPEHLVCRLLLEKKKKTNAY